MDLLIKVTARNVEPANPGAPIGPVRGGAVVNYVITGIPPQVETAAVINSVRQTAIYLPRGPYLIPWELIGPGKVVTADKLGGEVDLVGVTEAAEILGWDKRRVSTYQARGSFPEPVARISAGSIWLRSQIEDYRGRHDTAQKEE